MVPPDPSSLPIFSIADRYTRCMLECMVGYPLHNPKPFSELSFEYPREGVNIGDVGFVRADGTFDFLFNVCLSHLQSISINPFNLPDGFTLENEDYPTTRPQEPLPRNKCYFSQNVKVTESGEYICEGSDGAVLELPDGAIESEAIRMDPLLKLAKCRGVEWYKYTIITRGRTIQNGSLYLVTAFTKCTQWGIAVFDRSCTSGQGLTFFSDPLGWKGSRGFTTKVAQENTTNQCVFLRGYKIKLRQDIFDNLDNDQLGSDLAMSPLSSQAVINRITRQPAQRIRGGGGTDFFSRIFSSAVPSSQPIAPTMKKSEEVVLYPDFNSPPFHPSDLINTALLNENPDAKIAIIHDDVWCDLLRTNFPTLNYASLINIAQSYTTNVDEYGCISLEKISDRSNVLSEAATISIPALSAAQVPTTPLHTASDYEDRSDVSIPEDWIGGSEHDGSKDLENVGLTVIKKLRENISSRFRRSRNLVGFSNLVPDNPFSLSFIDTATGTYTRCMLACKLGYPLYQPQPTNVLSKAHSDKGINVGDVGLIENDGSFSFLLSICPSKADLIDPPALPSGLSIETLEYSKVKTKSAPLLKKHFFSPTVTRTKSGEYICKGPNGAILETPEGVIQHEVVNTKLFRSFARRHGRKWYEYAISRSGYIPNGSLCLVTSVIKCTQWGIAVFDRATVPGTSLKFEQRESSPFGELTTTKYYWGRSLYTLATKVSMPNQTGTPNQCVFLHGYKIYIQKDSFDIPQE